ncbi:hypothetical protein M434DRAFT_34141 [Hypoxylon sp. CO27-5]|nr:hypothetical protein M434DRAFT_34141 [Hypoxylon sp. CO27-5]
MDKWLHVHVVFLGSAPTQSFNGTRFIIIGPWPPVLDRTCFALLSTHSANVRASPRASPTQVTDARMDVKQPSKILPYVPLSSFPSRNGFWNYSHRYCEQIFLLPGKVEYGHRPNTQRLVQEIGKGYQVRLWHVHTNTSLYNLISGCSHEVSYCRELDKVVSELAQHIKVIANRHWTTTTGSEHLYRLAVRFVGNWKSRSALRCCGFRPVSFYVRFASLTMGKVGDQSRFLSQYLLLV